MSELELDSPAARHLLAQHSMEVHGPTFKETWGHLSGWLVGAWILAILFWVFSINVWWRHRCELLKEPRTLLRELYMRISTLSVVFTTTSLLTILFPRPAFMFALLRAIYESFTLKFFEMTMTELLVVVAGPGEGYASMEDSRNKALKLLLQEPPQKYYGAPPLGCFCICCQPRVTFTDSMLTLSKRLVSQYVYLRPLCGLIILWMILDSSFGDIEEVTGKPEGTILGVFETISMLVAMEGLFMLYWASRNRLNEYRCGLKFVAIKLVIFVSALQEFVIDLAVPRPDDGSFYDHEARAQLWSNSLLLIESAILTLLMWDAFPAFELKKAHIYRVHGKDVESPISPRYGGVDGVLLSGQHHGRSDSL